MLALLRAKLQPVRRADHHHPLAGQNRSAVRQLGQRRQGHTRVGIGVQAMLVALCTRRQDLGLAGDLDDTLGGL